MWGAIGGALLGGLGKIFSGGAKSSGEDRDRANELAILQDRTRADSINNYESALQDRRKLDMDQRDMDSKSRTDGYRQALHAQRLQTWQPPTRPRNIPMAGNESLMIPQASRDLAAKFEQDAMVKALQGEKFDAMAPIQRFTPTPQKQASLWEKMSGAIGLGLSGASVIGSAFGKPKGDGRQMDEQDSSGGYYQ